MARNTIADLDTTAANNTDVLGLSTQGSAAANTIDSMVQNVLGLLARFYSDIGALGTVGGTANAITLTSASTYQTLEPGLLVAFKATASNTGAATFNLDGLGAKAIRKQGDVALVADEILNNGVYLLRYDTSYNSSAGAWVLLNPSQLPPSGTPDNSIMPVKLMHPAGLVVEAQQNAPPGSVPSDPAVTYLVGTSGSGAWASQNNRIAFSKDGIAWSFIAPAEGMTVFDKATDVVLRFDGSAWATPAVAGSQFWEYTTPGSHTWNKPAVGSIAIIEPIGAGASGGRNSAGGGGGGGRMLRIVPLSSLSATETVTVGAGGAATSTGTAGNDGGDSSFGSHAVGYGGKAPTAAYLGGAGGGIGAGEYGGASGGGGSSGNDATNGQPGSSGGGGGGGGATSTNQAGKGGNSVFGGAGGGGGGNGPSNTGGASQFAGNGGAGGDASGNGQAGSAPGGGGGGCENGTSGAGGNGRVRVTVV